MRILVVTKIYPRPGHENVGAFNRQQFRILAATHDVRIIAPVAWTEAIFDRWAGRRTQAHYTNVDGINVRHPIYYYPPKIVQHRYGECYLASVRPAFERAIRESRPDVVLACFAYPDGWATVRLAHEAGLPVLVKAIGSDVLISGRDPRRRPRVAEMMRGADAIAAVSRDLAEHCAKLGADPKRLFTIPEGINHSLFRPVDRSAARSRLGVPPGVPMVLFVGNVLMSKGAGILVKACGQMSRAGVDYRCYLVGRGRDESRVRALVEELGLGDRVELVGSRSLPELPDWYGASDVVALPSYSEGIPNVLREAMACGRPFVATRVGGIPEIADPSTSILVDPGSPEAVAEALADVLGGRMAAAAAALGNGSGGASAISWEESTERLVDALKVAIGARSNSAKREGPSVPDRPEDAARAPAQTSAIEHVAPPEAGCRPHPARMRILVVTKIYPRPGHENVGTFNRQQFRILAADHDVRIIAPVSWTEELTDRWADIRTQARYTNGDGIDVRHPIYYYPPKIVQHRYGECYLASVRPAFERAIRESRPDVVLACFAYPDGWATVRLAHEAGLPAVVKCHGTDVLVYPRDSKRRELVSETVREAEIVVTVGRDLADHVIDLGADPDNVRVIPHGINRSLFCPVDRSAARSRLGVPPGVPMVLFVGNVLMSKGAGILVKACGQMSRAGVDYRCYLVGRGRDESRVRALVEELGLGDRVMLVGPRPLEELPDWYGASDVVTLPSDSEGIPNVLREAMACGRPFVATRVGGIPEIADPSTSILVDPGSPEAVAAALTDVLRGRMAAAALGNGSGGASAISWEESAERLVNTLREAITRRPS